MKLLPIFLAIVFAYSPLQARSRSYGLYIYIVDGRTKVDIYQVSGDDHMGLSVAEAVTFLDAIEISNGGIMISVVATDECERTDYTPVLKAILNSKSGMYLSGFSGWGGERMRAWIERRHTELAEHAVVTPH